MTCRPRAGCRLSSVQARWNWPAQTKRSRRHGAPPVCPRLLADSVVGQALSPAPKACRCSFKSLPRAARHQPGGNRRGVELQARRPGARIPITLRANRCTAVLTNWARRATFSNWPPHWPRGGRRLAACAAGSGAGCAGAGAGYSGGRRLAGARRRRPYVFRHALIRDAAYDIMPISQQRRRHEVVAQAIVEHDPQQLSDARARWLTTSPAPNTTCRAGPGAAAADPAPFAERRNHRLRRLRSMNDQLAGGPRPAGPGWSSNGCVTQALMNKYGWAHPQVAEKSPCRKAFWRKTFRLNCVCNDLDYAPFHHVASNRADVVQLAQAMLQRRPGARRQPCFGVGALVAGLGAVF